MKGCSLKKEARVTTGEGTGTVKSEDLGDGKYR